MQYITLGIGFLLAAVLMAWLGVRRRKSAREGYEDDARRYTATTMMKVVEIGTPAVGSHTTPNACIPILRRAAVNKMKLPSADLEIQMIRQTGQKAQDRASLRRRPMIEQLPIGGHSPRSAARGPVPRIRF